MGEERRKRTAKRRRAVLRGAQKSCSDSEVAQSKLKEHKFKKDLLPWPKAIDTLTVDELAFHRRRRVQDSLKDTLDPYYHGESDSAVENLVTEYRRAFRAFSEDSLLLKNNYLKNYHQELEINNKPLAELDTYSEINNPDDKLMESDPELLRITGHASRPLPIRRGTSLRRGGEFYSDTESSNYKIHEGIHRVELARRPTSLKMEGDMQTVTEQCEKFTGWMNVGRPELARIPTHLKMEGRLETSTESHDQYVPFIGARRPDILRQRAHLKLEGESNFNPEYNDVFRRHASHEKRFPMFPESHLKTGGGFSGHTEHFQNFVDPRGAVPIDDTSKDLISDTEDADNQIKIQNGNQRTEDDMKMLVSKLEHLKGPPLEVPEYKDAYKDFPRERPKLLKPEDEIGRADGSKINRSSNSGKFPMKIDQDPEYKSKYLDRDRPVYRKPPLSRRPSIGSSNFGKRLVPDMRQYIPTSEVRSQYVPYGHVPRVETLRMPINLRPEGSMNLQPEYRDAYCRRRDHSVIESRYRKRDRSDSGSKRRESNWVDYNHDNNNTISNQNNDPTEMMNSGLNSFQVLHSKAEHDDVAGKPPLGSRRSLTLSQTIRPTHLDMNPSAMKNQSPSPTYRLHVCNVDDESRGFNRRRKSSLVHQLPNPVTDPTTEEDNLRPYSPSFGKNIKPNDNEDRAFVVLDDSTNNRLENRKTRFDNNSNVEMTNRDSKIRCRNETLPNWMPPWYDNTSTI